MPLPIRNGDFHKQINLNADATLFPTLIWLSFELVHWTQHFLMWQESWMLLDEKIKTMGKGWKAFGLILVCTLKEQTCILHIVPSAEKGPLWVTTYTAIRVQVKMMIITFRRNSTIKSKFLGARFGQVSWQGEKDTAQPDRAMQFSTSRIKDPESPLSHRDRARQRAVSCLRAWYQAHFCGDMSQCCVCTYKQKKSYYEDKSKVLFTFFLLLLRT